MNINAKYSITHSHAWAIRAVYTPYTRVRVLSHDIWTPEIFGSPMQTLKTNPAIQTLETNPANHLYPEPSP